MTPLPSRVAVHEAGHAVVMLGIGMTLESVSISRGPDGVPAGITNSHQTIAEMLSPDREAFRAENLPVEEANARLVRSGGVRSDLFAAVAASYLAGAVAEAVVLGSAEPDGLAGDVRSLDGLFAVFDRPAHAWSLIQEDAFGVAESILIERREAAIALASALDERKALTGAQVDELLRGILEPTR